MKHLETPESRRAFEIRIEGQMMTLKSAWIILDNDNDRVHLDAIHEVLNQEWLYSRSNKEWLFSFEDSGWNSVMAPDKATAIKLALEEYKDSVHCKVRVDSFRVKREKDYQLLLSLFY